MYSLAFSFWESSNGITWLPLYYHRDCSTPGSTLARVIVYFLNLTGSVKEQGQILISLSIDRAGLFFFFSFKDLRKGRYMPNYPSFLASVKCRETKFMYWSEGKKTPSNLIKLCCVWQPLLLHRELFYRSWRKIDFQVCPLSLLPYDRNICLCCDKLRLR